MRPDATASLFPCAFSFFSLFSHLLLLSGREANLLARVWGQQRMRLAPFLVCPNLEPAGASSESSAAGGHKKKEKEKGIVKKKTMEKKRDGTRRPAGRAIPCASGSVTLFSPASCFISRPCGGAEAQDACRVGTNTERTTATADRKKKGEHVPDKAVT